MRKCPVCNNDITFFTVFKTLVYRGEAVQCPHCLSYISSKGSPKSTFLAVIFAYLLGAVILSVTDENTPFSEIAIMILVAIVLGSFFIILITYYATNFRKPPEK